MLGRTLVAGDEANPNAAVISFETWRRAFHADPGAVGGTIELQPPETMISTRRLCPR